MTAQLIDGKLIAQKVRDEVKEKVAARACSWQITARSWQPCWWVNALTQRLMLA